MTKSKRKEPKLVPAFDLTRLGLIPTEEVAAMFGVTKRCILQWAAARTFPAPVKVRDDFFLWCKADVDEQLAEYRKLATGTRARKLADADSARDVEVVA